MLIGSETKEDFISSFNSISSAVYSNAVTKGFVTPGKPRNEGEVIALIHSEVSEALEAMRAGNPPDDKIPQFTGVEAEFADVIIRIMDIACDKNYRVAEAIVAKMQFNSTRPHMHGGKKF